MADDYTPSDEDVYGVWTNYQCFYADDGYGPRGADRAAAEMDRYIAKVKRDAAREAEAERDEWRQAALEERGAALDLLEQVKARDERIQAVRDICDRASRDAGTLDRNLLGGHRLYPKEIRRALDGDA